MNFGFFLGACIASLVGVAYKKQKDSTITSTHVQQNTQMKRIKGLHIKFTEEQKALIWPLWPECQNMSSHLWKLTEREGWSLFTED